MATIAMTAAVVACSATTPAAFADDRRMWLNDYWNTGRVLKEWLDWRAALGWGAIGAGNVILTATSGASKGDLTKVAVGALCGTGAAGVMATWKPLAEPTTASHVKAVMKGASVVAASSVCGWMTHFAFKVIDHGIPIAERAINNLYPKDYAALKSTMEDLNREFLAAQNNMEYYQDAVAQSKAAFAKVRKLNCGGNDSSPTCKKAWDAVDAAEDRKTGVLDQINYYGRAIHDHMERVNQVIGG